MFKVTPNGSNRLDIELSGKLDARQMRAALDELESKSRGIEHGTMLYDIVDFHLPTLQALIIEFSHLPAMFALIKKFDRAAVLADAKWLRKISEFEGALVPGLEIRGFGRQERAEAEAWLGS